MIMIPWGFPYTAIHSITSSSDNLVIINSLDKLCHCLNCKLNVASCPLYELIKKHANERIFNLKKCCYEINIVFITFFAINVLLVPVTKVILHCMSS